MKSRAAPAGLDITTPSKHISSTKPSKATSTRTSLPAGIVPPVNENPKTVEGEVERVKPFEVAEPSLAPVIVTPAKLNWKPPTASSFCITTDSVPASVSTLSNVKLIEANTVVMHINKKVIKFFMLSYPSLLWILEDIMPPS